MGLLLFGIQYMARCMQSDEVGSLVISIFQMATPWNCCLRKVKPVKMTRSLRWMTNRIVEAVRLFLHHHHGSFSGYDHTFTPKSELCLEGKLNF